MAAGDAPHSRTIDTVAAELVEEYPAVTAEVYDDGTKMTPMLSITVDSATVRADVLRALYGYESRGITVDAVHDHRIVVRE